MADPQYSQSDCARSPVLNSLEGVIGQDQRQQLDNSVLHDRVEITNVFLVHKSVSYNF